MDLLFTYFAAFFYREELVFLKKCSTYTSYEQVSLNLLDTDQCLQLLVSTSFWVILVILCNFTNLFLAYIGPFPFYREQQ